jgi:hypothetical protein
MSVQFYITIPSNSTSSNTAATFETQLPVNINLEGDWEVGLAEIIYANTWHNVSNDQNIFKFFDMEHNIRQVIRIPPARYESVTDLIDTINTSITIISLRDKIPYDKQIQLSYNDLKKVVQLAMDTNMIKNVRISSHLLYMLGFFRESI